MSSLDPGRQPLHHYGVLSFTYFAGMMAFSPYAPLWFTELGFSTLAIGTIASIQAWTRVLAPYGWSWVGDHSGRRIELIRIAAAGCLLSSLGLLVSESFSVLALMTAVLYMCNGGVVPLFEASMAQFLNTARGMDTGRYGRVRAWGSVGSVVSVLSVGALLQVTGLKAFPWVIAAFNLALLVVSFGMPVARAVVVHDEPAPAALHLLRKPEVAWFFASAFFTVLAHTALYAFLSLYLVHLGYSKAAVGALWAVSIAMEILFFWFQGRWLGLLSPHRWLQWVAAVSALRFAATAAAGSAPVVLVLAQMSHAITFGAHHLTCTAMVHRLFPGRLRGRGQALYTILGYGLSGVLGGIGNGWLIDHLGFEATFAVSSGVGLLAWYCALRAMKAADVTSAPL